MPRWRAFIKCAVVLTDLFNLKSNAPTSRTVLICSLLPLYASWRLLCGGDLPFYFGGVLSGIKNIGNVYCFSDNPIDDFVMPNN